jgi:hypothetical protein
VTSGALAAAALRCHIVVVGFDIGVPEASIPRATRPPMNARGPRRSTGAVIADAELQIAPAVDGG